MKMLPRMSHAERIARRDEKYQTLLDWLASGEVWTDLATVAQLWNLSRDAAALTLRGMIRERLIVREDIKVGLRATTAIYGISPAGIACADAPATTVEHQVGRLNARNIEHSLSIQRARLAAERAGWTNWQPGRLFYHRKLPVVPDAVGLNPDGKLVAIEVERNVKSAKRRREVVSGHVLAMAAKHWQRVLYLTEARCDATRLRDLYLSLDQVDTPSGRADFSDQHRARFDFVNLTEWGG